MLIVSRDAPLRARLAAALEGQAPDGAIVTTELDSIVGLRASAPGVPLVFLATRRAQIPLALDTGADAAVLGCARTAELAARLRVIAGRRESRLRVGALEIAPAARTVRLDGVTLELPRREYALLHCLASAPGRVFTKAELVGCGAPASSTTASGRSLERRLARLRRRLGRHAPMLVTVWGIGYRLGEPD